VDRLAVRAASADVSIRGGGNATVVRVRRTARGSVELSDVEADVSLEDGRLVVSAPGLSVTGIGGGGVDVEIEVPERVRVGALETGDGDLEVRSVAGDVAVTVDDGDVSIEGLDGTASVSGDDGDVTLQGIDRLEAVRVDDGDVDVEIADVTDDAAVRTDDGDVRAALSPNLDAVVQSVTDDGTIDDAQAPFDRRPTRRDGFRRGVIGAGTRLLQIRTDDGDITLTRA
jgi:DUF4097 and DUF4098 domain-containing protein YvlB